MRQLFGFVVPILVALVSPSSNAHGRLGELDWRAFVVPDFGTRGEYPAGVFAPAGRPGTGVGQRFQRADGLAILSIYSRRNESGETPTTYLKKNLRAERSALDYARIARQRIRVKHVLDTAQPSELAESMLHAFEASLGALEKHRELVLSQLRRRSSEQF
jgi:hypothetical protein